MLEPTKIISRYLSLFKDMHALLFSNTAFPKIGVHSTSPSRVFRLELSWYCIQRWLAYFIPIRIPKDFGITLNSLTQQRWTLLFMTGSIHKWQKAHSLGWPGQLQKNFSFLVKFQKPLHIKRLDVNKGAMVFFEEFLDKISPLCYSSSSLYRTVAV